MNRLFIFIVIKLGSWVGWWIGKHTGIMKGTAKIGA
jgi:hypothetical protein